MRNKFIHLEKLFALSLLMVGTCFYAQIRIANSATNQAALSSSAFIDASSNTTFNLSTNVGKGLLYPRMDLSTFTAFSGAPIGIPNSYPYYYDGFMVYNTASSGVAGVGSTEGTLCQGFWYYQNSTTSINGGTWRPLRPDICAIVNPVVTTLNCSGATHLGTLTPGTAASGVSTQIPYTGGNGSSYPSGAPIASTGVTGLTATLQAGTLANGNGALTYTITGTPSGAGTASFSISFGGHTCSFAREVNTSSSLTFDCNNAVFTPSTITAGTSYSGTLKIPYTGGDGVTSYDNYEIPGSTHGLTIKRVAGTLASGNGTMEYTVTGNSPTSGNLSITVGFSGFNATCTVTKEILVSPNPVVTNLNCGSSSFSPATITQGEAYTGILTIPYTGGNGASYPVDDKAVDGLNFHRAAGILSNGSGNLTYLVSGTPANSGAITIPISIGSTSCSVNKTVAFGNSVVMCDGKRWMTHNLGGNTNLDPDVPVAGIHGSKYQWGRYTPIMDQNTDQNPANSSGAISGWNTTSAPNGAWGDSKTSNDPCPSGFKVPTAGQWNVLGTCAHHSVMGSFFNSPNNYGSALVLTSGSNKLTLPATGWRISSGALNDRGGSGHYWTSTFLATAASEFGFSGATITSNAGLPIDGMAVRCIAE
ncbi:FISUMP domain-containing protein [Chryseobacterium potabilaquae]|uniref:Uncharacterized protein n=1 Tax=Chryseobacterium potabilaquae TaxID=2675057 RepID=A0A6N4X6K7_9FLAO|nr:FISUMP domain-containing protein [Chryseobacterium potabilaquae]CAA7196678.1 hypothetical protein CHRY9293_02754 [Chryseobacterium potabilaquae]